MNITIPILTPLQTSGLCSPFVEDSRWTSRHQIYEILANKNILTKKRKECPSCINNKKLTTNRNPTLEAIRGQGLMSTK